MSFKVQKVEEYIKFPEGKYTAQIDHYEYVYNEYGNYYLIQFKILNPSEYESHIYQEKYKIEHENNIVRHIAINNFSRFCIEIGKLKEGDEPEEKNFLFKIVEIYLKNKTTKDGKTYTNLTSVELVDEKIPETPSNLSEEPPEIISGTEIQKSSNPPIAENNLPFDDEVPF